MEDKGLKNQSKEKMRYTYKIQKHISQAGVAIEDCVICDSYEHPCTLVHIRDECNYGSYQGHCVICGGPEVSDAYYCKECTI
uniref:PHD finger protein 5A n=1 Tax=Callithrix jacchus TaxID=9483 RepID=A0A8I3WHN5_CALJA